jgi:hypothetical protein
VYFGYEKVLDFVITLVGYVMHCSFAEIYPSRGMGYMYFVYEKVLEFEITLVDYVTLCSFVQIYPSGGEW